MPGDGLGLRSSKGRQPAVGPSEWPRPRPFFCDGHGNRGGAEAPLEGKGEDAHVDLEWKGQRSARARASPPPGPSLRSLGSSSAQDGTGSSQPEALQTRGKRAAQGERGWGGIRRLEGRAPRFLEKDGGAGSSRTESPRRPGGRNPPREREGRNQTGRLRSGVGARRRGSAGVFPHRGAGARLTAARGVNAHPDPCAPLVSYLRSQFLSGEGLGAARSKLWRSGRPHKCFSLRWR